MDDSQMESAVRGISIITIILGAWLVVSPYLLGYSTSQAVWNQTILGIVVAIFAIWQMANPIARWAGWINVVVGAWLIVSPFILGYEGGAAYWNQIVAAIVVVVLSLSTANVRFSQGQTHHHAI